MAAAIARANTVPKSKRTVWSDEGQSEREIAKIEPPASIAADLASRLLVRRGSKAAFRSWRSLDRGFGRLACAGRKGARGVIHEPLHPHQGVGSLLGQDRRPAHRRVIALLAFGHLLASGGLGSKARD